MRSLVSAVAAVIVAIVSGPAPVAAQEGSLFGSGLLSVLGITAPAGPDIDYRERPGLVVPPRSTLPPPVDSQQRRSAANWPDDPDTFRRSEAGQSAATAAAAERFRHNSGSGRLSNSELARGRNAAPGRGPVMASPSDNSPEELYYGPIRQMREADARRAAQARVETPLGQEPPRRFLTEPPAGFRAPTQRLAPGPQGPVIRSESTGQREFVTGQPLPQ